MAGIEDELRAFPAALHDLIADELAAGNAIIEIGHGFPAPPVGAWAMLARPVGTRPRQPGDGLTCGTRNWNGHSFEWSDGQGAFFVLEPPTPYRQPSMEEIRAGLVPRAASSPPARETLQPSAPGAYAVDIDHRGEMVTYREADRQTDVTCTWSGRPTIVTRTLGGWWYPGERRSLPMEAAERRAVLDRIVEYLRRNGAPDVAFEE